MAKTVQKEKPVAAETESKKQQKKQARLEAKAMLKLERARQDEQKAEKKVAKAQAILEAQRTRVRKLETKVAHTQEPHQLPLLGTSEAGSASQQEAHDLNGHAADTSEETSAPPTNQVATPPPVEGRTDIGQGQDSSEDQGEEQSSTSDATDSQEHEAAESAHSSTHRTSRRRRSHISEDGEEGQHEDEATPEEEGADQSSVEAE